MEPDDAPIDEDARGPGAGVDEDRAVRRVDRVDDESVGGRIPREHEVRGPACKVRGGAIQVADDAGIGRAFEREDGVIGAGVDVVGFEVKVVERWVGRGEDAGFELEGL